MPAATESLRSTSEDSAIVELDAAVIGAGFAGLYALHKLRNDLHLNVQSFENGSDVGGTWFWNRYPGARSDTEVTAYCYSFDRELFSEWRWSQRYPRQKEIWSYLSMFADRYDLRRSIVFDTTVESATFDEHTGRWLLVTDTGQRYSAQFLIEGVGLLSSTNVPNFPGQENFRGEIHHTARWPEQDPDFRGKRVGVVGTGSSGAQVITEVAPECGHLTVFQRTPQYIVPAQHGPLDPHLLARIDSDYDGYWRSVLASVTAFGFDESDVPGAGMPDAERDAIFEQQWNSGGGFQFMFATFNDIGTSREANNAACDFIRRKIAQIVPDPETAAKLTPHDLYAKRPICCDNYYETFNRANVSLVDANAHPILEITEKGVRTDEGEYELDIIVFATGFDAVTGNFFKIDHRGRNGVELRQKWVDRPRVHLGLMSADFPNLFMIFGPMGPFTNQPPAHEVQVNWVADVIAYMREQGLEAIEPEHEAEDQWLAMCDEIAYQTLFPETDSWINGANVPGKPKAVMFYMAGMGAYMEHLQAAVDSKYAGFRTDRTPVGAS
ncbi:flavin-containing monooxygenase [uncultured Jatrophihabitans sp.]|uniref:flavin-containing monooxygenase n=1 Tax=uncultured Jatrophihabitans sp. TaxID=1610747 RepID=UPI0035CB384B